MSQTLNIEQCKVRVQEHMCTSRTHMVHVHIQWAYLSPKNATSVFSAYGCERLYK